MATKRSEVHAYSFILNELVSRKGWTKQQVYTQQECQNIPAVAKHLKNQRPENIVEVKTVKKRKSKIDFS